MLAARYRPNPVVGTSKVRKLVVLANRGAVVQLANEEEYWKRAARIRSECYFENRSVGRFASSYKKQFEEQEVRRLEELHVSEGTRGATFVATDESDGNVVGSVDVREYMEEKDECIQAYAYNLCVSGAARRKGIGIALMHAAAGYTHDHWGARVLHVHVDSDNLPARTLYEKLGFQIVGKERKNDSPIGHVLLLKTKLPLLHLGEHLLSENASI